MAPKQSPANRTTLYRFERLIALEDAIREKYNTDPSWRRTHRVLTSTSTRLGPLVLG